MTEDGKEDRWRRKVKKLMEKKTGEEREKVKGWKVRLSEKGYLKNGGMKE